MSVVCEGGYDVLFGTQCSCVLMQGEPGFGMKGEKGEAGTHGSQVRHIDPLLS